MMDLINPAAEQVQNVLTLIRKQFECSICLELLSEPVGTKCGHRFCRFCILQAFGKKFSITCPLCKKSLTKRSLQSLEKWTAIVSSLKNLTTAFQLDSGTLFTPSKNSILPSSQQVSKLSRRNIQSRSLKTKSVAASLDNESPQGATSPNVKHTLVSNARLENLGNHKSQKKLKKNSPLSSANDHSNEQEGASTSWLEAIGVTSAPNPGVTPLKLKSPSGVKTVEDVKTVRTNSDSPSQSQSPGVMSPESKISHWLLAQCQSPNEQSLSADTQILNLNDSVSASANLSQETEEVYPSRPKLKRLIPSCVDSILAEKGTLDGGAVKDLSDPTDIHLSDNDISIKLDSPHNSKGHEIVNVQLKTKRCHKEIEESKTEITLFSSPERLHVRRDKGKDRKYGKRRKFNQANAESAVSDSEDINHDITRTVSNQNAKCVDPDCNPIEPQQKLLMKKINSADEYELNTLSQFEPRGKNTRTKKAQTKPLSQISKPLSPTCKTLSQTSKPLSPTPKTLSQTLVNNANSTSSVLKKSVEQGIMNKKILPHLGRRTPRLNLPMVFLKRLHAYRKMKTPTRPNPYLKFKPARWNHDWTAVRRMSDELNAMPDKYKQELEIVQNKADVSANSKIKRNHPEFNSFADVKTAEEIIGSVDYLNIAGTIEPPISPVLTPEFANSKFNDHESQNTASRNKTPKSRKQALCLNPSKLPTLPVEKLSQHDLIVIESSGQSNVSAVSPDLHSSHKSDSSSNVLHSSHCSTHSSLPTDVFDTHNNKTSMKEKEVGDLLPQNSSLISQDSIHDSHHQSADSLTGSEPVSKVHRYRTRSQRSAQSAESSTSKITESFSLNKSPSVSRQSTRADSKNAALVDNLSKSSTRGKKSSFVDSPSLSNTVPSVNSNSPTPSKNLESSVNKSILAINNDTISSYNKTITHKTTSNDGKNLQSPTSSSKISVRDKSHLANSIIESSTSVQSDNVMKKDSFGFSNTVESENEIDLSVISPKANSPSAPSSKNHRLFSNITPLSCRRSTRLRCSNKLEKSDLLTTPTSSVKKLSPRCSSKFANNTTVQFEDLPHQARSHRETSFVSDTLTTVIDTPYGFTQTLADFDESMEVQSQNLNQACEQSYDESRDHTADVTKIPQTLNFDSQNANKSSPDLKVEVQSDRKLTPTLNKAEESFEKDDDCLPSTSKMAQIIRRDTDFPSSTEPEHSENPKWMKKSKSISESKSQKEPNSGSDKVDELFESDDDCLPSTFKMAQIIRCRSTDSSDSAKINRSRITEPIESETENPVDSLKPNPDKVDEMFESDDDCLPSTAKMAQIIRRRSTDSPDSAKDTSSKTAIDNIELKSKIISPDTVDTDSLGAACSRSFYMTGSTDGIPSQKLVDNINDIRKEIESLRTLKSTMITQKNDTPSNEVKENSQPVNVPDTDLFSDQNNHIRDSEYQSINCVPPSPISLDSESSSQIQHPVSEQEVSAQIPKDVQEDLDFLNKYKTTVPESPTSQRSAMNSNSLQKSSSGRSLRSQTRLTGDSVLHAGLDHPSKRNSSRNTKTSPVRSGSVLKELSCNSPSRRVSSSHSTPITGKSTGIMTTDNSGSKSSFKATQETHSTTQNSLNELPLSKFKYASPSPKTPSLIPETQKGSQNKLSQRSSIGKKILAKPATTPLTDESRESASLDTQLEQAVDYKKWSFTCSSLKSQEKKIVERFSQLLGCDVQPKFDVRRTTHVIVRPDRQHPLWCFRTLKYFQGISAHKWIVSFDWVIDCLKEKTVLSEEEYEINGDTAENRCHYGPKRSRESRDCLFKNHQICCLGEFDALSNDDLRDLIEGGAGVLISTPNQFVFEKNTAKFILINSEDDLSERDRLKLLSLFQQIRVPIVNKNWLLDSIGLYLLQPSDNYIVNL